MLDVLTVTLNPAIDQTVNINNFKIDSVNRVEKLQNSAAGKGVNVASYLASSDLKVGATGFLGSKNCEIFEEFFKKQNIENRFIYLDTQTRVNVKIVDPKNKTVTDVNQMGFEIDEENLIKLEKKLFSKKEASWYVFSGSLPKGIDNNIYEKWIKKAHDLGVKVAFDASGEALICGIKAKPELIKPNNHELSQLLSKNISCDIKEILPIAKDLINDGIETVCVSMGEKGSLIVNKKEAFHAIALKAEVSTTVGAGDALLSGLVYSKINELSLEESIKLASTYSLNALKTIGAYLSSKEELKKLSNDLDIMPISLD
jgi:1-phosphofructokinase